MKQNGYSNNYYASNNTPNFFGHRNRLLSFNTPKLSPLRMAQSPFPILTEPNFFESQLNMGQQFRLQEPQPAEQYAEAVQQSEEESYSELEFPKFPENEQVTKEQVLIYFRNMIQFLVATINIQQDRIQKVREQMQRSGQTFLSQVFHYLYKRFKKTKKTKEEMIKYTMRKSFKFITDQMKKQDPTLIPILSTDGIEGMSIYFTKHSDDKQISIPFKKNSAEKTMNTAFLKSVFSVEQFGRDYRKFLSISASDILESFQNQFIKDNKKKMNSMTDAVKVCLNTKNYKSLENYKRIPWTTDILGKLKCFAMELLSYSPHKGLGGSSDDNNERQRQANSQGKQKKEKQAAKTNIVYEQKPRKTSFQLNSDYFRCENDDLGNSYKRNGNDEHLKDLMGNDEQDEENDDLIHQLTHNERKIKKKSVIILTPPMLPLSDPIKFPDQEPLQ